MKLWARIVEGGWMCPHWIIYEKDPFGFIRHEPIGIGRRIFSEFPLSSFLSLTSTHIAYPLTIKFHSLSFIYDSKASKFFIQMWIKKFPSLSQPVYIWKWPSSLPTSTSFFSQLEVFDLLSEKSNFPNVHHSFYFNWWNMAHGLEPTKLRRKAGVCQSRMGVGFLG